MECISPFFGGWVFVNIPISVFDQLGMRLTTILKYPSAYVFTAEIMALNVDEPDA